MNGNILILLNNFELVVIILFNIEERADGYCIACMGFKTEKCYMITIRFRSFTLCKKHFKEFKDFILQYTESTI